MKIVITAFNGSSSNACGRAQPIALEKDGDSPRDYDVSHAYEINHFYYKVGFTNNRFERTNRIDGEELRAFEKRGRVTLLTEAIEINLNDPIYKQRDGLAMLYVTPDVETAGCTVPQHHYAGEKLQWVSLKRKPEVRATCASYQVIEGLLDEWGEQLLEKVTEKLPLLLASEARNLDEQERKQNLDECYHLTSLAVDAAREEDLRYQIYLTRGIILRELDPGERFFSLFETVKRRYPERNLSRTTFKAEVKQRKEQLANTSTAVPYYQAAVAARPATPPVSEPKPSGSINIPPTIHELINEVHKALGKGQEILEKGQEFIEKGMKGVTPFLPARFRSLSRLITQYSSPQNPAPFLGVFDDIFRLPPQIRKDKRFELASIFNKRLPEEETARKLIREKLIGRMENNITASQLEFDLNDEDDVELLIFLASMPSFYDENIFNVSFEEDDFTSRSELLILNIMEFSSTLKERPRGVGGQENLMLDDLEEKFRQEFEDSRRPTATSYS